MEISESEEAESAEQVSFERRPKPKIRNKWKAAFHVIRFTKQRQKVRFVMDPCMAIDIGECPIEAEDCTVDESLIHYVDSITKTDVVLCTKERYFWEFLNSNIWSNRMRITKGQLQTTLIDNLKSLARKNKVEVFQSVKYTTSSHQIKRFMKRDTLPNVSTKYNKDKNPAMMCFRSTTEYYCKKDIDIYNLYPRLSSISCTDSHGRIVMINNTNTNSSPKPSAKIKEREKVYNEIESQISTVNESCKSIKEEIGVERKNEGCSFLKHFFLPRVNPTFTDDLLDCIGNFKLKRECVTNNKTWHTVQEIIISRLD